MDRDAIIARLIAVAREARPEDLIHIARCDRHEDPAGSEKHRSTLEELIFHSNGIMTDEMIWYPSEAVELCAHVRNPCHERAFAVATALLLARALTDEDAEGNMALRWPHLHECYASLSLDWREPILAGFVWLSMRDGWDHLGDVTRPIDPASVPHPRDLYREACGS